VLKILIIGLGGFIGAISRYKLGGYVHILMKQPTFPYGTLFVNLTGCFLIGLGGGFIENRQFFTPELRAFIFIGFLGSFTTFSTFGLETFNLIKNGEFFSALANICFSVILGLLAVLIGNLLSKFI